MKSYNTGVITTKGLALMQKALSGTTIEFTRIALGDGVASQELAEMNDLVNERVSFPVDKVFDDNNMLIASIALSNEGLVTDMFIKEIGLFANDPDVGEILFKIATSADYPDLIPAEGEEDLNTIFEVNTLISSDSQVSISYDKSLAVVHRDEFEITQAEAQENTRKAAELSETVKSMQEQNAEYFPPVNVASNPYYCNNEYSGQLRTLLRGKQVFNLIDNGVDYSNWIVSNFAVVDGKMQYNGSGVDGFMNFDAFIFKPSTEYTFVVRASNNNCTQDLRMDTADRAFSGTGIVLAPANQNGIFVYKYTSAASFSLDGMRAKMSGNAGTGSFEILALVEGDATAKNIDRPMKPGWNFAVPVYYEKVNSINLLSNEVTDWEQGQIDSAGVKQSSPSRVRLKKPLKVHSGQKISYRNGTDFYVTQIRAYNGESFIETPSTNPYIIPEYVDGIIYVVRKADSSDFTPADIASSDIVINYGDPLNAFVEYKEPQLRKIDVSNKCPDGLTEHDFIDVAGLLHKEWSDIHLLNGSEDWRTAAVSTGTDVATISFELTLSDTEYSSNSMVTVMCDKFTTRDANYTWMQDEEAVSHHINGSVRFRVLRSRLATEDLAGFKTWLASNNVQVRAQLKDKVTLDLHLPDLMIDASCTYSIIGDDSFDGVLPDASIQLPMNQAQSHLSLLENVQHLNEVTKPLEGVTALRVLDNDKPTISFEVENGGIPPVITGSGKMTTNLGLGIYIASAQYQDAIMAEANLKPSTTYSISMLVPIGEKYYPNEHIFETTPHTGIGTGERQNIVLTTKTTLSNTDSNQFNVASNAWRLFKNSASYSSTDEDKQIAIYEGNFDYGYVKGSQSLSNVAFDIRGENLISDVIKDETQTTEGVNISTTYSNVDRALTEPFVVEGGKDYTRNTINDAKTVFFDRNGEQIYYSGRNGTVTHKAPDKAVWVVVEIDMNEPNRDSLMFVQGTAMPNHYVAPLNRTVYEKGNEHFTEHDTFTVKEGKMIVDRKWSNPIKLFGSKIVVDNLVDYVGYKRLRVAIENAKVNTGVLVKPNGKIIRSQSISDWSTDGADVCNNDSTHVYFTISDRDSGWGENFTEISTDEFLAFLNGWVVCDGDGNAYGGTGTKFWYKRYQGIGSKNTLPLGADVESGTGVNSTLQGVPVEKAYGDITECYTFQCEHDTPEQYEVDMDGVLTLPEGKIQVTMLSGIRKEIAELSFSPSSGDANINLVGYPNISDSPLKRKVKRIIKIECHTADGVIDVTNEWNHVSDSYSYGEQRVWQNASKFKDGDYYVIYETLQEENNSAVSSAALRFKDDLISIIESQARTIDYQDKQISDLQATLYSMKPEIYYPTLLNGATDASGSDKRTDFRYEINHFSRTVRVVGLVNGYQLDQTFAKLPSDVIPKGPEQFGVALSNETTAFVSVTTDGSLVSRTTTSSATMYVNFEYNY